MPRKNRVPVRRRARTGIGNASVDFTNAEQIKNRFLAHTSIRQAQRVSNDGSYWTGGNCQWGGSHNLLQDCQQLANFANSTATINNDIQEMTLSTDEQTFNSRKQQLISKLQENINKCNVTSSSSLASVCIIWNYFFGFVKGFAEGFRQKLQQQLTQLQSIEPIHQKEILRIEAEIKEAESKYQENFAKAERETDPAKKAKFMALANEALDEVTKLKSEYSKNPLASLNKWDYLNDLERLINGDITEETVSQPSDKYRPTDSGNTSNSFTSNSGSNSTGGIGSSSNIQNNQQLLIFAAIAVVIIFLLLNKKEQEEELYY